MNQTKGYIFIMMRPSSTPKGNREKLQHYHSRWIHLDIERARIISIEFVIKQVSYTSCAGNQTNL